MDINNVDDRGETWDWEGGGWKLNTKGLGGGKTLGKTSELLCVSRGVFRGMLDNIWCCGWEANIRGLGGFGNDWMIVVGVVKGWGCDLNTKSNCDRMVVKKSLVNFISKYCGLLSWSIFVERRLVDLNFKLILGFPGRLNETLGIETSASIVWFEILVLIPINVDDVSDDMIITRVLMCRWLGGVFWV